MNLDASDAHHYLQIGMKLSGAIAFGPNDEYPIQCNFIGMKEGQFLIFELGAKTMGELITRRLNNADVVIRGIADTCDGHIIAFRSKILCVKQLVTWLMFVKFPRYIESRKLRENRRYKLNLDTHVSVSGSRVGSRVVDVSLSGCGLCFEKPVALKVGDEIKIDSPLEHVPEPYPKCTVANIRRVQDLTYVGIKFEPNIEADDELRYEVFSKVFMNQTG
ncbi:hypothetical protein CSW98_14845 [Vibrio sp. HA2012]|uniref:PilZ domain-containing protein n=1 Tax=Vibrio sp. HA2012 TaxID=1971595 RepID=UPI000C2CDF1A|nr:PilZ domain-containing protein [Vibrio sp. HA2012]PJC85462.1 hypothetical protein CSW98_14845 [Vibrio sp. HA2012]